MGLHSLAFAAWRTPWPMSAAVPVRNAGLCIDGRHTCVYDFADPMLAFAPHAEAAAMAEWGPQRGPGGCPREHMSMLLALFFFCLPPC